MLLANVITARLGFDLEIGYVTAMLINITLWIAIAPLAAVGVRKRFP
jgi:hypothetical protein